MNRTDNNRHPFRHDYRLGLGHPNDWRAENCATSQLRVI
jgi:hypothetical protein